MKRQRLTESFEGWFPIACGQIQAGQFFCQDGALPRIGISFQEADEFVPGPRQRPD